MLYAAIDFEVASEIGIFRSDGKKLYTKFSGEAALVELWPEISQLLQGVPLVAHNAAIERAFLTRHFPLSRLGPWIDTLKLVRLAYPSLADFGLGAIFEELRLAPPEVDGKWHNALFDAAACAELLEHLLALPGWNGATVEQLVRLSL